MAARCPPSCPLPSVDNSGRRYPGCALARIKTQAEVNAMRLGSDLSPKESR